MVSRGERQHRPTDVLDRRSGRLSQSGNRLRRGIHDRRHRAIEAEDRQADRALGRNSHRGRRRGDCAGSELGIGSQFGWASLLFGAVYLTCCRVLFGQGALVNLPYDESVLSVAKLAILAVPIAVAGGGWLSRLVLPGKLQRFLGQFYDGKPYRTLLGWTLLLLLLRIALLYFGMKESVELGYRLAFSIVFVPAYLIVFGLGCANLFWERSQAGEFRFDLVLRFIGFAGAVFMAQALSGLLVSDLGLFLYLIAQALVLAAIGAAIAIEQVLTALRRERAEDQHKPWHSAGVARTHDRAVDHDRDRVRVASQLRE